MTVPSHPDSLATRGYVGLDDAMSVGRLNGDPVWAGGVAVSARRIFNVGGAGSDRAATRFFLIVGSGDAAWFWEWVRVFLFGKEGVAR